MGLTSAVSRRGSLSVGSNKATPSHPRRSVRGLLARGPEKNPGGMRSSTSGSLGPRTRLRMAWSQGGARGQKSTVVVDRGGDCASVGQASQPPDHGASRSREGAGSYRRSGNSRQRQRGRSTSSRRSRIERGHGAGRVTLALPIEDRRQLDSSREGMIEGCRWGGAAFALKIPSAAGRARSGPSPWRGPGNRPRSPSPRSRALSGRRETPPFAPEGRRGSWRNPAPSRYR
jgi:hypothetical protein